MIGVLGAGLLAVIVLAIIVLVVIIRGGVPSVDEPTVAGGIGGTVVSKASDTPSPTVVPTEAQPTATVTVTSTPEPEVEILGDTDISNDSVLGELEVEYPMQMSPESSNIVIVSIYVPIQLASASPMSIERIVVTPDAPRIMGKVSSYYATMLIAKTMRVELSSARGGFEIENLYPPVQQVNIYDLRKPTYWAWTIKAPSTLGSHVLVIRAYLGEAANPSWVGCIEIEVVELTPTPVPTDTPTSTPTLTPTPTLTQIPNPTPTPTLTLTPTLMPPVRQVVDQLIDNSAAILIALITLSGSLTGVYATIQKSKRETHIKTLELQLQIAKDKEEQA